MIRSVRRVLLTLTSEREMTEDQLYTFMCEAVTIVFSRPLTPVMLELDSELPLTKSLPEYECNHRLVPVAMEEAKNVSCCRG